MGVITRVSDIKSNILRKHLGICHDCICIRIDEKDGDEGFYFLYYLRDKENENNIELVNVSQSEVKIIRRVQTGYSKLEYYQVKARIDFFKELVSRIRLAKNQKNSQEDFCNNYKYREYKSHFQKQHLPVFYQPLFEIFAHVEYVTIFSFMRRANDDKYYLLWHSIWYDADNWGGREVLRTNYYFGDYLFFDTLQQVEDMKILIKDVFDILKQRNDFVANNILDGFLL